jgi:hypothetical protein
MLRMAMRSGFILLAALTAASAFSAAATGQALFDLRNGRSLTLEQAVPEILK